jgi:hypothetical protein
VKTIYFLEKNVEYSVKLTVGHGYTKKKRLFVSPLAHSNFENFVAQNSSTWPLAPWTHVSSMAMDGSWVMDGVSSLGRWRQRKNAIAVGEARQLRLPPRESSFGAAKTILLLCFALSTFTSIDCASLSIVLLLFSAAILVLCSVFCAQSCWVPACRRYILCSLSREEGQQDKVRRFIINNGSR